MIRPSTALHSSRPPFVLPGSICADTSPATGKEESRPTASHPSQKTWLRCAAAGRSDCARSPSALFRSLKEARIIRPLASPESAERWSHRLALRLTPCPDDWLDCWMLWGTRYRPTGAFLPPSSLFSLPAHISLRSPRSFERRRRSVCFVFAATGVVGCTIVGYPYSAVREQGRRLASSGLRVVCYRNLRGKINRTRHCWRCSIYWQ